MFWVSDGTQYEPKPQRIQKVNQTEVILNSLPLLFKFG